MNDNVKLRRVLDIQRELDLRKELYEELDRLALELLKDGFQSAQLDGFMLTLVDNFREKNTVFRTAGVKQYEIRVKKLKP